MPSAADVGGGFSPLGLFGGFVFGTALSHILGGGGPPAAPFSSLPASAQRGVAWWLSPRYRGGWRPSVSAGTSSADRASGPSTTASAKDRAKAMKELERILSRRVGEAYGILTRPREIGRELGRKIVTAGGAAKAGRAAAKRAAVAARGAAPRLLEVGGRILGPAGVLASIYTAVPSGGITPEVPIPRSKAPSGKAPAVHGQPPSALPGGAEVTRAAQAAERAAKAAERAAEAAARAAARPLPVPAPAPAPGPAPAPARTSSGTITVPKPSRLVRFLTNPFVQIGLSLLPGLTNKPQAPSQVVNVAAPDLSSLVSQDPWSSPLTAFDIGGVGSSGKEPCKCGPKKPRKKRPPRSVCYRGTFYETPSGTRKVKKERIPCQASSAKRP